MRKPMLSILTALLVCLLLLPTAAMAAESADFSRACSLKLTYSKEGKTFSNCGVEIFRVAEVLADGSYRPVAPFDRYPVRLNGITSQKEWQNTAVTLEAYVAADKIAASCSGKTDGNGTVSFRNLQAGLYLVRGITARNQAGSCRFESTMILLPRPQDDGSMLYDLEAKPKGSFTPNPDDPQEPTEPEMEEYRVIKLWKDSGFANERPSSVTVELYKNGIHQQTVTLDAKNNWTYTWEAPAGNDAWSVLERDVARDYTVTITSDGNTFTISNSRHAPAGSPPKTGDSFPLAFLTMVTCLSGVLLLAMGIGSRRKYR